MRTVVGPSPRPIVDQNLTPMVWASLATETHRFESYLEEKYPNQPDLVSNPAVIVAPAGERTFLPHRYYKHFTASGRAISPSCGRWEMYDAKKHRGLVVEFINRWKNPSDSRVR